MGTDQEHDLQLELERHRKILWKIARMYCSSDADCQDLTQETMIQIWRSWSTFDGRSRLSTWIYRVALNVAISWSRNEFRRERHGRSLDEAEAAALASDHAAERSHANLDLLQQMLQSLNELDRALLILHLEGYEQSAIAEIVGITNTNVATKIARIKQRLQQQFSNQDTARRSA